MWTLVHDTAELGRYRAALSAQWGFAAADAVDWGAPPTSYPVLVAAHRLAPVKVLSAYVYPPAAAALLAAAQAQPPAGTDDPALVRLVRDHSRVLRDQTEFNTAILAHFTTLLRHIHRVGICDPAQYERDYTAQLARVDQWTADDRRKHFFNARADDDGDDPAADDPADADSTDV